MEARVFILKCLLQMYKAYHPGQKTLPNTPISQNGKGGISPAVQNAALR